MHEVLDNERDDGYGPNAFYGVVWQLKAKTGVIGICRKK